jgi:opacity protein-like surface antigen
MMVQANPARTLAAAALIAMVGAGSTANAQGTGFYVRADLGIAFSRDAETRDENCGSPNPFFGCGTFLDSSAGNSVAIGGGFGYRFVPWFRSDLTLNWRPMFDVDGTIVRAAAADRPFQADVSSITGMLNGYIDIAGFLPRNALGVFQPYVGAGLGLAHNSLDDITSHSPTTPGLIQTSPGGSTTDFAWMITAGTGISAGHGIIVDIGYKYLDMGEFSSDAGQACAGGACRNIDPITGDLKAHEFSVGVRYGF